MAPTILSRENPTRHPDWDGSWKYNLPIPGYVLESWSQGFMVGAIVIMAGLTIANMRKHLLLHKLILIELILAVFHGTFCFMDFSGYGWYVSSTAALLYSSWYLHNIIAWLKTKPFLRPLYSRIYIWSFLLTTPFWILETYGNFTFNNNIGRLFLRTRPFEALCRDPWWIFTAVSLLFNIKRKYNFSYVQLIRTSPRFGVMLVSMSFSIVFLIVDVLASTVKFGAVTGINPYWKLSLIFKCFCDVIILDDFRSALEKIRAVYFNNIENKANDQEMLKDSAGPRGKYGVDTNNHSGQTKIMSNFKAPGSRKSDRRDRSKKEMAAEGYGDDSAQAHRGDTSHIYVSTDITLNDDNVEDSSTQHSKEEVSW